MKKFLTLLVVLIMCVSCEDTYRMDDYFVIYSKRMRSETYKYEYGVKHILTNTANGYFLLKNSYILSNDNYELGDTIRLVKSNN